MRRGRRRGSSASRSSATSRRRCPSSSGAQHTGTGSTQQALGRLFVDLDHDAPEVSGHVVTVAPDVASSTNLGGWINRSGIWSIGERIDWFADDSDTLVRWRESDHGRHVELGIAEVNLVGLLGELGATWSRDGRPLLPVGTIYDPFVMRAHEPWSFGIYAGGQSILVGTPSGITLGPEGGAHQSVVTPSVGIEQPGCVAWEPAFTQDFEWSFLHALGALGREDGSSAYFRLSTRPIDQALAEVPPEGAEREQRRADVLAGGYRLREGERVTIVAVGAVVPEALEAAAELDAEVVCLTSPDLVFRALQARAGLADGRPRDPRAPVPGAAPAGHRARRPPAHAGLPGRRARRADRVPRAWRSSASRATSPTSTATTASTPRRSSARRSTCA